MRPKGRAAARRETRLERAQRISDAYGLVLVLILITFVVTMTLAQDGGAGRVFSIVIAALTAIVALTSSDVPPGRVRSAVIIAFASVLAGLLGALIPSDVLLGFAVAITAILLAIAALTILRRVVTSIAVDFRTILGAISVFTLIGLLFGFGYLALGRLQSGEVFAAVAHPKSSDFLFFSYTTLTTTGYGNLVPSGVIGEILSVFEMLIGQIFLVTLVAGLVSLWRPGAKLQPDELSS
jgi:hypothetical protein